MILFLAILYYDYCLTFDDEVRFYWSRKRKWNIGTFLFFINRYLNISGSIVEVVLPFAF